MDPICHSHVCFLATLSNTVSKALNQVNILEYDSSYYGVCRTSEVIYLSVCSKKLNPE